jgi:hypothetical protein
MNGQGVVSMTKDEKPHHRGAVGKFDAGGELGPIEDRNEFERRLDALPPDQKELAQENTRFADLCRYFSDKKMDIPPQVLDQVGSVARLPIVDRIRVLQDANRALMEYLSDVGEDPQIRQ